MKKNRDVLIQEGEIFEMREISYDNNFKAQIIKSSDAVCIAATLDGTNFFLVSQFRYGIDQTFSEFPAGKIDPGETPEQAAYRELREEIGYTANNLVSLGKVYSSPAILSETLYLYYADDLEFVGQDLDEDEELIIRQANLSDIRKDVLNNTLNDAKTLSLLYRLEDYLKSTQ